MSNLEVLGILGAVIVALTFLIVVGLAVSEWAQGFTPNKDPNRSRHHSKEDEIPGEDWAG